MRRADGCARRRRRSGMALVAALGLMMLAAGLLAGTVVASLGLQRASRTLAASARAEAALRRGLATVLQGWDAALDSMPVGAIVDRARADRVEDGVSLVVRTRVRRLGASLYAATVAVQVGDSAAPIAVRRGRLVLRQVIDSLASSETRGIRPLARWSVADTP